MTKRPLLVEVANTSSLQERGLMFRNKLGENEGMLFKFEYPHKLRFWGINTYLPLDVAFISSDNKVVQLGHIKPLSSKVVESKIDCAMAIEANLGFFQENKVKIGDKIAITEDELNTTIYFPEEE